MNQALYSTLETARLVGVTEYRLNYAHRTGRIPLPDRIAGRRIYTQADLERVKKYFNNLPPWKRGKEKHDE